MNHESIRSGITSLEDPIAELDLIYGAIKKLTDHIGDIGPQVELKTVIGWVLDDLYRETEKLRKVFDELWEASRPEAQS